MDPIETYKTMLDHNSPGDERDQAALDLLVWLARGGAWPECMDNGEGTSTYVILPRHEIVAQIELHLNRALEMSPR